MPSFAELRQCIDGTDHQPADTVTALVVECRREEAHDYRMLGGIAQPFSSVSGRAVSEHPTLPTEG